VANTGRVADDTGFVGLAPAIEALRQQLIDAQQQLIEAQAAAAGRAVSFAVGKVDVELTVAAKTTGGGGLGLRFGVFSVDGKADRTSGSTHKVKLELVPIGPNGEQFLVAGGGASPPAE
jgi:hypothetical protein